jgi:hypothetical protein
MDWIWMAGAGLALLIVLAAFVADRIGVVMRCSVCGCCVTEPYCNPLGMGTTCWYHADYFYIRYPERIGVAQLMHPDVPVITDEDRRLTDAMRRRL